MHSLSRSLRLPLPSSLPSLFRAHHTSPDPHPLSLQTLSNLPTSLSVPKYSRASLSPGIVHFGVGNFHRAHQAHYLHRLFDRGLSPHFAIIGAATRPQDLPRYQALKRQQFLYTLVERGGEQGDRGSVVASIIDYVPPGRLQDTLQAMTHPRIKIVSLTITEGGYTLAPPTPKHMPASHRHSLTSPTLPDHNPSPSVLFDLIVSALDARRHAGVPPFTILSCDNVPHNGAAARAAVCAAASARGEHALSVWIASHVAFPNSMVDRITPSTGSFERALVADVYGVRDEAPVCCEMYTEWVLEDVFSAGRPEWEAVGVRFVQDAAPYERLKMRVLNGAHAALGYPAALLGVEMVHEAVRHELVGGFVDKMVREEVLGSVGDVEGVDAEEYWETVRGRFGNEGVGDTVGRLCEDGWNRQGKFIVGTARERVGGREGVEGLALASALWCRYCYGETDGGELLEGKDERWDELRAKARVAREDHRVWVGMKEVYGDLEESEAFQRAFGKWLGCIWRDGVAVTLAEYIGKH